MRRIDPRNRQQAAGAPAHLSDPPSVTAEPAHRPSRFAVGLLVAACAEAALLALWQRNGFWEVSDGVYAATARAWLHGHVLYRDVAGAQPPLVYLVGLALLAVHDGLAALRAGLALVGLVTAGLTGLCVWRLTERHDATAVAVLGLPLITITLHEHAQLVPETLAAPLLIGGVLLCADGRRPGSGGLVLAVAAFCKLAFGLPAVAIVLAGRHRARAAIGLATGLIVLAATTQIAFGVTAWRQIVQAQLQVGTASLHYVGGLLAQAAWNEFPIVLGAAGGLWLWARTPARASDRPSSRDALVRTLAAAAGASLGLALTLFKRGSYIDVLVAAEPPLFALAVCGVVWGLSRSAAARLAALVLGGALAAQSLSLLVSPGDPWAARRPGARSGLEWTASPAAVNRALAAARRCPRSAAYGGPAYLAFLAHRRMPGQQPDLFMLAEARIDARFALRAGRDQPRCPAG